VWSGNEGGPAVEVPEDIVERIRTLPSGKLLRRWVRDWLASGPPATGQPHGRVSR
jgi:hypothetical protein